jgi:DNA-binding MarR family transcriptional regulator
MTENEVAGADPVRELFDQVRLLFHELSRTAERLHADEPVTVGTRAILEWLLRHGAGTVPQIARSRSVARQHIQPLVNSLVRDGLVALEANPAHQRSPLVHLTADGEELIRRMLRREELLLAPLLAPLGDHDLRQATRTLEAVRHAIGGSEVEGR